MGQNTRSGTGRTALVHSYALWCSIEQCSTLSLIIIHDSSSPSLNVQYRAIHPRTGGDSYIQL